MYTSPPLIDVVSVSNCLWLVLQFEILFEFIHGFRYMKGRIVYDQVNNQIDELNKVFNLKSTILSTRKQKRSVAIKKQIAEFNETNNKATQGFK